MGQSQLEVGKPLYTVNGMGFTLRCGPISFIVSDKPDYY